MSKIVETENIVRGGDGSIITAESIQNASAVLALLHGKSDSICKVFNKEIIVTISQLKQLNQLIYNKLALHNIGEITTVLDIALANKKILTFKSWYEFELHDFSVDNSSINSIFVQWDFFVALNHKLPQRHTVSVRISSSPKPSEFFKVILSGGLDEESDIEMRMHTTICKVDFINNTLAEELVNVVEGWNELCESAISKKGRLTKFLCINNDFFAHVIEICFQASAILLIAIIAKCALNQGWITFSNDTLFFLIISLIPLYKILNTISRSMGKEIYNKFGSLMEFHIFDITTGDKKKIEKINNSTDCRKQLFWFVINFLVTLALSLIFFCMDFNSVG